ncbi:zinc finger BED domain-containing protein RICESLEEPER 2-like protein [Tanacetum coccineum]
MQDTGATNLVSPMYGSTTDPMQSGGENCVEVDVERDIRNNNSEDELELKSKRQKTSKVWGDFIQVTLPDGKQKVECIHCNKRLAVNSTETTSTWARHMNSCLKCKQYLRTQQVLNFPPADVNLGIYKTLPVIAPNAKYDANKIREAIANWIMVTEQPFSTVKDEMFIYMIKTANPLFERISRPTAKADCFKVYKHEKKKLKTLTNSLSNVSLTTNYWRLQKHVLSFVHVPPPRSALDIAYGIYKCLKEWEIKGKIFSISADNSAYNDKVINNVIEEVREAVKYVNYLKARRQLFFNVAHQLQIHDRKLMLDVPTRWNSTYDMLSLAFNFKYVFPRYEEYEPHFCHLPSDEDWDNVIAVCEVLKVFKVCTNIISGSDYTTANLYLKEVYKVKQIIDKSALSRHEFISNEVSNNTQEVLDALDHMFKEYVEMHDELVSEAASHKNRSCGCSTSLRSNEDLLGSEWEEFANFYKDADVEKYDKSELKMYLDEGLLEGLSTVASEATFSAGGRVIDPYRSALKSSTVEMLLYGGDWIRHNYGLKKKVKGMTMAAYVPLRVLWPGSSIIS